MTLDQAKAIAARLKAGIVGLYFDSPQLTSMFGLLILFLACSGLLFGFWGFWLAFAVAAGLFLYGAWHYPGTPRDEYGADGN